MKMLNSHKCGDAIKTDTNKKIDGVQEKRFIKLSLVRAKMEGLFFSRSNVEKNRKYQSTSASTVPFVAAPFIEFRHQLTECFHMETTFLRFNFTLICLMFSSDEITTNPG